MSVEAIGALQEPVRRAVYERAVATGEPVSRNEIADALGIGRTLAAHHLDKLVEAGLLEASFARVNGRSGPGAGRPAKLYRRSPAEHALSLPPRDYRMLAEMLADAVEAAGADGALQDAARRQGERVAAQRGDASDRAEAVQLLKTLGFEPYVDGSCVRLRNCPFDAVAKSHPGLVCGASLAFVEGLLGQPARLDPRPEGCCVAIEATKNQDH
jgi:predicted ArsR family transcriptional regulator